MKTLSVSLSSLSAVVLSTFFLCLFSGIAYSQSSNRNYILTRTFTTGDGHAYQEQVDYYDGLGRPAQSVLKNAVPNGGDIVTLQNYDNLGRKSNLWNPVAILNNAGQYVLPATLQSSALSMYADSRPYSKPVYEPSPLNRMQEQYGPGEDWHLNSKSVKTTYLTNVSGNDTLNCICYSIADIPNDTVLTLTKVRNYDSSQLFVTRMEDEDGNASFEFKDKQGQVILTRSILRNGTKDILDTYFIYNAFGNLVAVLPPEASAIFGMAPSSSWRSDTDQTLLRYAFLYKYNTRNLQVAKKLPGCSWSFYIYDKGDRLIFSQDGNQRERGQWFFSIPDALGRVCFSGVCGNSLNALSNPLEGEIVKAEWQYGSSSAGTGLYKGYTLVGVSLTSPTLLQVNFYNDYSFLGKNGVPPETDAAAGYDQSAEAEGFSKRYASSAQGLLTGMLTAQFTGTSVSSYLYSVMYYDSYGRMVQTKSSNHLSGGVEKEYVSYNFIGQPLKRKHIHSATGKVTQTEVYAYSYDQTGRLLTTTHQLNNASPVTLVSNTYDEVGRLISNQRNGVAALKTDYTYNVRSWMKSISGSLFSQNLYYNDQRSSRTNDPRYNGNLSGMDWLSDGKNRGYDFSYDCLSRLTGAGYLEGGVRSDKFDTSYSYDRHGNLLTLSRHGNVGTTTYGIVDNLTLNYSGNQLLTVEDAGTNPSLSMSMDFKNGTTQDTEYFYDSNGNQVKDLNKGISRIEYNVLNLPHKITFSGANNPVNEYVYSAGGQKLSVIHKSSTDKRTDYAGTMIYENGSLKRILVDGGYIENGTYYFYLQDHLGNNRVVAKADGTVVQTNHYYPYGMPFAESTQTSNQPYKYNGKELDTQNGLNWYDYEARQMESIFGRFTTVDPLVEKFYSWSPYAYCGNNPITRIDPDGRETRVAMNNDGTYRVIGGELNKDRNIYVYTQDEEGNYTVKGGSIGITTSTTSFYNADANDGKGAWAVGSIINPNDKSGDNFLSNIFGNTPAMIDDYMANAGNGGKYDFKVTNGTDKPIPRIDTYRGMPIGKTGNGQNIFSSARDIGNIAAGYVAGANGMPWEASRIAFDTYQSKVKGQPSIESISTRNAEYYGWRIGSNIMNNTPIQKANNLLKSLWNWITK